MPKTDRLIEHCDWIDLGFVEREATPRDRESPQASLFPSAGASLMYKYVR